MAGQNFVVNIGNVDLAVSAVVVRVQEDSDTKRPVGNTLSNDSVFTYFNDNVAAPSPIFANDNYGVDTLDWDFVSGFNSVSDYEYHLGDNQWQDTTMKPIVIGNIAIASNSIKLRVKATDKNAAGAVASLAATYTIGTVPAAPVISSEDDDANTLTFTAINGYDNVSLYQIKIADRPWQTASNFTITLEDIDYAAGAIQVRLAENLNAATPHPAGIIASNQQVFTPNTDVPAPAAPTNPIHNNADDTFGFTLVSGYSSNDDYEYTLNGGTTWNDFFPLSRLEVSVGNDNIDAGQVGVRVKTDEASNRPAGVALFSTQAYTSFERFPTSPGNFVVDDTYGVDTLDWQYVAGYSSPENYEYNLGDGQWVTVSQKPIVIGNIGKGSSTITMRVKASEKNDSSIAAYVSSEFTVTEVPAAPTIESENDATNEIVFNPIDGYIEANLFEVKIADGDWATVESFTINLEDIDYTVGSISIRLAENLNAATPHPAGQSVSNTKVFTPTPATPTAPTGLSVNDTNDTLDWQFVTGYEQYTDYEIQLNGSNTYQAIKQKPVIIGNINATINSISIRVKADAETGRQAGESASNPVAFTIPASQLLAVVADHQQTIDSLNTVLAEFNTLKAGLSGTGDALRTQAKTLNAKWFELATLIEQATTAQTAIDNALTSAASFETQVNKDAVQTVLNNLTTDLNAAKPLVAATDSAIIDAFNDAHSQASITQENAMIPLTTFAKLDVAGNLVETDTTVEQGWRCLLDTSAKTRVVWALLSPVKATDENTTFSDTQTRQSDVYNAQEICGVSTWQLPTNAQAKTIDSGTPQNWVKVTTAGEITDAAEFKYWLDGANTRLWQRVEDQSALATKSDDVSGVAANFASASWTLATQAIWQAVGDDPNASAFVATLSKDYKYWATPEGAYADFSGDIVTTGSWTSFGETAYKLAMADLNVADVPKVELITNSALFPNHNAQSYWLAEELDSDSVATGNIATLTYPDSEVAADNATTATSRFVMVSAPQTPALIATDDAKNKITISLIENYAAIEDYELTTDGGSNWNTLTSDNAELKTIDNTLRLVVTLSNANIDKNDIGIRVAKTQTIPASSAVNSDIDFTQSRCDGTEINGICYQAYESTKTWQQAIDACSAIDQTLLSRSSSSDWSNFASELDLSARDYWFVDEANSYSAYNLDYSGGSWTAGSFDYTSKSSTLAYICQKDFEAPTLDSVSVSEGDNDVLISAEFTLTFNEAIKNQDLSSIVTLSDEGGANIAVTVTIEDTMLKIKPDSALTALKSHTLVVNGDVNDLYNNAITVNESITFTTAAADAIQSFAFNGKNYTVSDTLISKTDYDTTCNNSGFDVSWGDGTNFAAALNLEQDKTYFISGSRVIEYGFGSWSAGGYYYSSQQYYICQID
ncbi:MAG: Ig-like domain-containing protein [Psychrobium sp.]